MSRTEPHSQAVKRTSSKIILQPPFTPLMKYVHQQGGDGQEQQHAQEQAERREIQGGGEGMVKQVNDPGKPFGHSFTSFSDRGTAGGRAPFGS